MKVTLYGIALMATLGGGVSLVQLRCLIFRELYDTWKNRAS
jgi:hypothetical protein